MAEHEAAESVQGAMSYRTRRIRISQWTSLGVVAITCASVATMTSLALVAGWMSGGAAYLPDWAGPCAAFSTLGFSFFGGITGLLAILTGTTDDRARRDARLGTIALGLIFLPMIVLAVAILVSALARP